jgi:hypothetical protein
MLPPEPRLFHPRSRKLEAASFNFEFNFCLKVAKNVINRSNTVFDGRVNLEIELETMEIVLVSLKGLAVSTEGKKVGIDALAVVPGLFGGEFLTK